MQSLRKQPLFAKQKLIRRGNSYFKFSSVGQPKFGDSRETENPLLKSVSILGSCLICEQRSVVYEVFATHFTSYSLESQSAQCWELRFVPPAGTGAG